MSFFNFGRKNRSRDMENNNTVVTPIKQEDSSSVNLQKQKAIETVNLRKETLGVCLKKNKMENVQARVAVVMDKSGSMGTFYRNGFVQQVIERLLPIALKLDNDGELDMWLFSDRTKRINSVTENDFFGYVQREILNKRENDFWGGTYYAPPINDVVKKYVQEEPSNLPTYVIFITDGENFDKGEAERAIKNASEYNIFWQFVGIGDCDFKFLKKLDDMEGRFIDNANFFEVNDLNKMSDEELYNKLLNEYPNWEKEAKQKGLLK